MKPFIIKEKYAAQPDICPPMKACPNNAFFCVENEDEPIGGRIEIALEKCEGFGKCAEICCGHCIGMK